MRSCIECLHYLDCNDPKKGFQFCCDRFKEVSKKSFSLDFAPSPPPITPNGMKELDLVNLIEELMNPKNKIPFDLRIDDRELPEFPNFYEFCISPHGIHQTLFARQMAIGIATFAEWCPLCSELDLKNIDNIPVDMEMGEFKERVTLLEYGVCPVCQSRKSELVKKDVLNFHSEFAGCIGQRGGKSAFVISAIPYIVHRYLKLQNPLQVLGLMQNSLLVGTVTALTYSKACELLWIPIHSMLTQSPWYSEYNKLLLHYNNVYGEELFKINDQFLNYRHRSLLLAPQGPSKRKMRGPTRIFATCDEIGWFDSGEENNDKERASANEVYNALDRSLKTVRVAAKKLLYSGYDHIPTAYMLSISSPSAANDKIMSLVRTHRHSREVYIAHLPTWEFNPNYTKNDFAKEYREDPVAAERDFGANPPLSDKAFLHESKLLLDIFLPRRNRAVYRYRSKVSDKQKYRYAELVKFREATNKYPSLLSIDAGYCITGDTLIHLNNKLIPIEDIGPEITDPKNPVTVTLKDQLFIHGLNGDAKVREWHYRGEFPVYTLETHSGVTIRATAEHQFAVMDFLGYIHWVKLKDLTPGDFLCLALNAAAGEAQGTVSYTPLELQRFNRMPLFLDARVAYFLGFFYANGIFTRYNLGLNTFKMEPNQVLKIVDLVYELFGVSLKKYQKTNLFFTESNCVAKWLQQFGFISDAIAHRVPKLIFESPKLIQKSFLDGCFWGREANVVTLSLGEAFRREYTDFIVLCNAHDIRTEITPLGVRCTLKVSALKRWWERWNHPKTPFFPTKITRIERGRPEKVYDLTVEETAHPSFTANGLLIHNSSNSFAAAVSHRDNEGSIVTDTLIEIAPQRGADKLNYTLIYRHLLAPIIEHKNVRYVLADRWQSIKLLQDLEEEFGLNTQMYSMRYSDFITLRDHILDEDGVTFKMPMYEMELEDVKNPDVDAYPECFTYKPFAHLLYQMLTVRDTGKSVEKGLGVTDDLFRAVALGWTYLLDENWVNEYLPSRFDLRSNKKIVFGVVAGAGPRTSTKNLNYAILRSRG